MGQLAHVFKADSFSAALEAVCKTQDLVELFRGIRIVLQLQECLFGIGQKLRRLFQETLFQFELEVRHGRLFGPKTREVESGKIQNSFTFEPDLSHGNCLNLFKKDLAWEVPIDRGREFEGISNFAHRVACGALF